MDFAVLQKPVDEVLDHGSVSYLHYAVAAAKRSLRRTVKGDQETVL